MQQTQNYKLNKPDITDYAKIEILNGNADIIDSKLKENSDKIDVLTSDLGTTNNNITSLDNKVTQHLADSMPHRFVDGGKTYRWGFRTFNSEPQFIYEEVV